MIIRIGPGLLDVGVDNVPFLAEFHLRFASLTRDDAIAYCSQVILRMGEHMMAVARRTTYLLAALTAVGVLSLSTGQVHASTPLVTGGLVVYYDFDSFTNTVTDGSGNGFNGRVQDSTRNILDGDTGRTDITTTGVISNETVNVKRGAGAIRFNQSLVPFEDPVFVDMDGSKISTAHPELEPKTAITISAWLNLEPINTTLGGNSNLNSPASVIQGTPGPGGHGYPHFHAEGDGKIRFTIRDSSGTNIVNSSSNFPTHPYPNQPAIDASGAAPMVWPTNTWFHLAATWDQATGKYDMYYNGTIIREAAQLTPGPLGLWDTHAFGEYFDGLGLGCVYDSGGRRTQGLEDELYIFNRALSAAEIQTLYNIAPPGVPGDYNGNGVVDTADYVLWRNGGPLQNEVDTPGTVNAADFDAWKARFGNISGAGLGASAAVPEPASLTLLLSCLCFFASRRQR